MSKSTIIYLAFFLLIFGCEDKVKDFSGFTQKELEFLLASEEGKAWERISKEEGGEENGNEKKE